ncbi:hypothetical protein V8C40DRAFT_143298 [Trichoderma camerunense]
MQGTRALGDATRIPTAPVPTQQSALAVHPICRHRSQTKSNQVLSYSTTSLESSARITRNVASIGTVHGNILVALNCSWYHDRVSVISEGGRHTDLVTPPTPCHQDRSFSSVVNDVDQPDLPAGVVARASVVGKHYMQGTLQRGGRAMYGEVPPEGRLLLLPHFINALGPLPLARCLPGDRNSFFSFFLQDSPSSPLVLLDLPKLLLVHHHDLQAQNKRQALLVASPSPIVVCVVSRCISVSPRLVHLAYFFPRSKHCLRILPLPVFLANLSKFPSIYNNRWLDYLF